MIIVVEIENPAGIRACKEYEAPTFSAAVAAAKRELQAYPKLQVTDVWVKEDHAAQRESADEW
ncbi:MAG: hypothetical protein ACLPKW_22500 [Acetobacteraceae bacterium]|jgi:hypothetical protein